PTTPLVAEIDTFGLAQGRVSSVRENVGTVCDRSVRSFFEKFPETSSRDFRRTWCYAVGYFDPMDKIKKRGRPRIRTAEYWRDYYTRKQREWRAAHPRIRRGRGRSRPGPMTPTRANR